MLVLANLAYTRWRKKKDEKWLNLRKRHHLEDIFKKGTRTQTSNLLNMMSVDALRWYYSCGIWKGHDYLLQNHLWKNIGKKMLIRSHCTPDLKILCKFMFYTYELIISSVLHPDNYTLRLTHLYLWHQKGLTFLRYLFYKSNFLLRLSWPSAVWDIDVLWLKTLILPHYPLIVWVSALSQRSHSGYFLLIYLNFYISFVAMSTALDSLIYLLLIKVLMESRTIGPLLSIITKHSQAALNALTFISK